MVDRGFGLELEGEYGDMTFTKGAAAVKLIFDLGGCPEDLEFSVTDITLIKKAQ